MATEPPLPPHGYMEFVASLTWMVRNVATWPGGTPVSEAARFCKNTVELYEGFVERNDDSGLTDYIGLGSKPLVQAAIAAHIAALPDND